MLQNAPLGAFCNTFYLREAIIGLEKLFFLFESDRFTQVFIYMTDVLTMNHNEGKNTAL